MTIEFPGNQPSQAALNNGLADVAIALRDAFINLEQMNSQVTAGVTFTNPTTSLPFTSASDYLQNGLGFTAPNAAIILSILGNLMRMDAAWNGSGTITPAFDFRTNAVPVEGIAQ